ncbi:hypothetical protein SAMN05444004_12326 [Jannaschia faecimaris]|uniref:Uncharacterized protein n=1 Tax=Jannaschia faecimaris TaxID=1244108 RepID=A0A1H3U619_9RHOB|nr:hypothetical protein [Jannaschia faecimaris]SDZ57285.1 hypothetical protein SAMN05444004_12326 [Jannaschia faecimaris]
MRCLILFLLFVPWAALAAQFETFVLSDDPSVPTIIHLKGEIESGDAEEFERRAANRAKVTLILESPGGLVAEALRIGATVRLRDFSTMVAADAECYSACGLVWLASQRRYIAASSQIGFHAAYRRVGDYLEESGEANALIGSYLTHLGLRIEAIRFFTRSGPQELALLTPFRSRALGIDIYLQDGGRVTPPWENPTVDRMAAEKVSLIVAGSVCEELLGKSDDRIMARVEALDDEGMSLVGDFWHELWLREIDRYKPTGPTYTLANACVVAEQATREFGYQLLDGPSFDCSRATTTTELAICGDANLGAKDRVMSNLYFFILESGNPKIEVPKFREFHADWLHRRNSCRANDRCLHGTYDELVKLYGAIHLDTEAR